MRLIALLLALLINSLFANAQNEKGVDITITINNIQNDNGLILLGLHTEDTFLKGKGILNAEKTIQDGKAQIVLKNVPKGEFAIMVLHDENSNHRMDTELNGMPKEAYGMSGNDMSFGPPVFEDAKFTVKDKNLNFEIRL